MVKDEWNSNVYIRYGQQGHCKLLYILNVNSEILVAKVIFRFQAFQNAQMWRYL